MNSPPPRLSALLASNAPVGVVFRRGPSKRCRLFLWDRDADVFEPGPVFKGRIFVDRSDISPDGRHLIYFAMGGKGWAIPETGGTWTAICRLPSLSAIALWGQGDTWGGGGMFTSDDAFWLDATHNTKLLRDDSCFRRETRRPRQSRMQRDGWIAVSEGVLEKALPTGLVLRKVGWTGPYRLLRASGEKTAEWEWAEQDRSRLVWTEQGRLWAATLAADGRGAPRMIADFGAPGQYCGGDGELKL